MVGDGDLEQRLAALEQRVRDLEDHLEVQRMVNSWGPAVDTGDAEAAAALWTAEGVMDSDMSRLEGPVEIEAMVRGAGQQSLIKRGCAHVQGYPVIEVNGDRATAVGYSRVYLGTDDGHDVWRVSANRWELTRTPEGWRITRRTNRRIDGGEQARDVLHDALRSRAD